MTKSYITTASCEIMEGFKGFCVICLIVFQLSMWPHNRIFFLAKRGSSLMTNLTAFKHMLSVNNTFLNFMNIYIYI